MFRRNVSRPPLNNDRMEMRPVERGGSPRRRRVKATRNLFRRSSPLYERHVYIVLGTVVILLSMGFGAFLGAMFQKGAQPRATPTIASEQKGLRARLREKILHRRERSVPSMVQMDVGANFVKVSPVEPSEKRFSWMVDKDFDDEECWPLKKWMLPTYSPSSCNILHELDMEPSRSDIQFINCGGSRCAFEVQDLLGNTLVMKIPKYHSNDDTVDEQYEGAWRDTIAMERLSSSPFVLDVLGNCGWTQLTEMAAGGSMHDLIKVARQYGDQMSPENKLRIGYQVATAVADVHSCDGDDFIYAAHNDLCCHQFLLVDGVYKLTDFHFASFTKFERNGDDTCIDAPVRLTSRYDKLRAPEEIRFKRIDNGYMKGELEYIHRDKTDVWMTGVILYYILTKKYMFEGMTTEDARNAILNGQTPEIPKHFLKSTNAADKAMMKAIKMTWVFDRHERPSARKVATFLREQLETLDPKGKGKDGIWRVSVPPLPANHSHSESDFLANLDLGEPSSSSSDDSEGK